MTSFWGARPARNQKGMAPEVLLGLEMCLVSLVRDDVRHQR